MTRAAWPRAEAERALPRISPLRLLRRRWLVIVLGVVVGTACALAVNKQQDERFEATGRVFLGTSQALPGGDHIDAARIVQTQAQLAGSTVALDLVSRQLGLSREEVAERLTVTASDQGDFFTITGRDGTE
ncbi:MULTISPECIES: hypothetical protein [Protofrankia]|uniref:hypothetical protein n=1 Tax=Protofrankia TaxID=2994361 RepID=UPI0001C533F9|nr:MULTISPECIES: hypothetical protein [Protofrankia]